MRYWFRLLQVILAGAATAVLIFIDHQIFWKTKPGTLVTVCALVLGSTAAIEGGLAAWRLRRDENLEHLAASVAAGMNVGLIQIARLTGLSYERLGLTCYIVPSWYRRFFPSRVRRLSPGPLRNLPGPALFMLHRLRIVPLHPPSTVRWTKGKGVVGRCWELRADVSMDCYWALGPHLNDRRSEWEQAPDDVRMRLSYEEFQRIKGKYGAAIATPIILDNVGLVGVLVLDTPWGDFYDHIHTDEVREWLGHTVNFITGCIS